MKRETFTLAISLLLLVISLTGVAMATTTPPVVGTPTRIYPKAADNTTILGFANAPGRIARDASGMIYVTDYWKQGVWKFDRTYNTVGFIKTNSRPVGVAVAASGDLIVSMQAPQAYVAFYNAQGTEAGGNEKGVLNATFHRPVGVAVDAQGYIYVVETGDLGYAPDPTQQAIQGISVPGYQPMVKVLSSNGATLLTQVGSRSPAAAGIDTDATQLRFLEPSGIEYDKASNRLFIADTMNGRIEIIDAYGKGTGCAKSGQFGDIANTINPQGVSFEYDVTGELSRVYVDDRGKHRVDVYGVTVNTTVTPKTYTFAKISEINTTNGEIRYPNDTKFVSGCALVTSAPTAASANVAAFSIDGAVCPATNYCNTKINPLQQRNSATSPVTVTGTVDPACAVTVNGVGAVVTPSGTWSASVPLALSPSPYPVNAVGTDSSNSHISDSDSTTITYTPTGQLVAPTFTVATPPSDVKNATLAMQGTATVAAGSTSATNGNVEIDVLVSQGAVSKPVKAYTVPFGSAQSWSLNVDLFPGMNTVTVKAWQKGAADAASQTFSVNLDTLAPTINNNRLFIPEGSTSAQALVNISGTVSESRLQSIAVNGQEVQGKVDLGGGTTYYSAPVLLVRGVNTVTVTATDYAGNVSTSSSHVTFNPDLNPNASTQQLVVNTPADNSFAGLAGDGTATILLSGKVASPTLYPQIQVEGNLVSVNPTDGTWSKIISLSDGMVTYPVIATGGTGTPVTVARTIDYGSSETAVISITDPAADKAVKVTTYNVKGQVATSGVTSVKYTVDGGTAQTVTPAADGTFSFNAVYSGATEQNHVVAVTVTMADGSSHTTIRNLSYMKFAPTFSYEASTAPGKLIGNVDANSRLDINSSTGPVLVTYDAYDPANNGIVWHADLTGLTNITFTVTDPAGNVNTNKTTYVPMTSTQIAKLGDVDGNGVLNMNDAMLCLRFAAKIQSPIGTQADQADVGPVITPDKNQPSQVKAAPDGNIDISDCLAVLRKTMGLVSFTNQ